MWQILSAAVVLMAPVTIIVYDMIARYYGGPKSTITAVIQQWTLSWVELPGLFAAFMIWLWIHLFLQSVIDRVNREIPPEKPAAQEVR